MLKYHFIKILRDKGFLFWTLVFPIALMICFHAAFSNLYEIENNFDPVPAVYVVNEAATPVSFLENLFSREEYAFILEDEEMQKVMEFAKQGKYEEIEALYSGYSEEELQAHFEEIGQKIYEQLAQNGVFETTPEENDAFWSGFSEEELSGLEDYMFQMAFVNALSEVSKETAELQCFELSEADSLEEARNMLVENEKTVLFYIEDGDVKVELSKEYSSVELNIVGSFVGSFKTQYALMSEETTDWSDFANMTEEDWESYQASQDSYASEISNMTIAKAKADIFEEEPNPYNWYYYATLVMAILFNVTTGIEIVGDTQADVTKGAMRISVSSQKKSSILLQAFLARFIVVYVTTVMQLLIMNYAFEVPIGNRILQILLFIAVSNLFSLSLGGFLGLILKGKVSERNNKATALIMTSVFLSGEMVCTLPGFFELYCPIINRINPATILNFAFYNLVYFESLDGFYKNMFIILAATIVLLAYSIFRMRKQKYRSI